MIATVCRVFPGVILFALLCVIAGQGVALFVETARGLVSLV